MGLFYFGHVAGMYTLNMTTSIDVILTVHRR